jgi:hypothetical protein
VRLEIGRQIEVSAPDWQRGDCVSREMLFIT